MAMLRSPVAICVDLREREVRAHYVRSMGIAGPLHDDQDSVYRIRTAWPSAWQAFTPRYTRLDPLLRTVFTSTLQLPFRSSTSTDTELPGTRNSKPSRSSCQLSVRSSE